MPYTNNIPQPTDQLSVSQGQLLGDIQALAPCVGGIFTQQGAAPAVAATQVALVDLADGAGAPQLYLVRGNTGTTQNITGFLPAAIGYSFLPSGMIMKWGTGIITGGPLVVNYDITYPFTHVYSVLITQARPISAQPAVAPYLFRDTTYPTPLTGFRLFGTPALQLVYSYLAIGTV